MARVIDPVGFLDRGTGPCGGRVGGAGKGDPADLRQGDARPSERLFGPSVPHRTASKRSRFKLGILWSTSEKRASE